LFSDEKLLDNHKFNTGIRQVQLDPKNGLLVNGKTVKLRGAGIHHDNGIIGAVTLKNSEYRRISILKKAGFNAVRIAHQPAAPALLRACDEIGMYVMDESFDIWNRSKSDYDYSINFAENWEKDIELMVSKDFNHPSVILYSIGNEIPEIATDQGLELCSKMYQKVKALDQTRYVLAAVNGMYCVGNEITKIVGQVAHDEENINIAENNVNEFMTYMDKYLHKIVHHPAISKQLEK
jgi:Beta-galactosidase/beta-glucuronidase